MRSAKSVCKSKRYFPSRKITKKYIRASQLHFGKDCKQSPYKCSVCYGWHITSVREYYSKLERIEMAKTVIERFNSWIKSHPGNVERLAIKAQTCLGWSKEQFWDFIDDLRRYAQTDQGAKKWATRRAWGRTIDNCMFRQGKPHGTRAKRVSDIKGPSGPVKLS